MLQHGIAQHGVKALVGKTGHVVGVSLQNGDIPEPGAARLLIPIFSEAPASEGRFKQR